MIRNKTTWRAKSGGVQNGNGAGHPRSIIDETRLRENRNAQDTALHAGQCPHWDPAYCGLSNPSRPKNYAISIRPIIAEGH
jgi:hypothetical protein